MTSFGKRKLFGKWLVRLALLGSLCLLHGCIFGAIAPGECVGAGDIELNWLFEGYAECPEDVTSVIVQITDINGDPVHVETQGDEYNCVDGRVVYRGLVCGAYQVRLQAIDDRDEFTWDSGWVSTSIAIAGLRARHINLHRNP